MKMKKMLLCTVMCGTMLTACQQAAKQTEEIKETEVCNPIPLKFGDPYLLYASDGRYYMYGTSLGDGSMP